MHKERLEILNFFEVASLLRQPDNTDRHRKTTLDNELGTFHTVHIHDSKEFTIREYSCTYNEDYTLRFRTEEVLFIEISFFLNAIPIRDRIDGKEQVYLPYHAYIHHTPKDAEVEVTFLKSYEYRNLDIYLSLSFFNEWAESNRNVREFIRKIDRNESAQLFPSGVALTPEAAILLNDIKKCTLQGISREYFIKAEVHHLLSLLFEKQEHGAPAGPGMLSELRKEDVRILESIRALLASDYDKFYTIGFLAKEFGINEFKLKKGFKKLYGKGLFEYSTEIRMKQAMELIRNTDSSLKEIAFQVGYASPSSFCVAFKKEFGMSPARFR